MRIFLPRGNRMYSGEGIALKKTIIFFLMVIFVIILVPLAVVFFMEKMI